MHHVFQSEVQNCSFTREQLMMWCFQHLRTAQFSQTLNELLSACAVSLGQL